MRASATRVLIEEMQVLDTALHEATVQLVAALGGQVADKKRMAEEAKTAAQLQRMA